MIRETNSLLSNTSFYALTAAAAVTALLIVKSAASQVPGRKVLPSPRESVFCELSSTEAATLPYPPDVFPGARDVETPYGSIRVYEWGPKDGRKVLLVHGISTPCIALGGVAHELVDRGCRVMIFDLFGRGYSDCPADLPHDDRLYSSQILLVLASSQLPWTGYNAFSLVGYSLGGAIGVNFTSSFPHLVDTLILLGPGGLIRPSHIGWSSKFVYSTGLVPETVLQWLVKRRLQGGSTGGYVKEKKKDASAAVSAELRGTEEEEAHAPVYPKLSRNRPNINATLAVSWQLANHVGFVPAFMSSIRYAPIVRQHAAWYRIRAQFAERTSDAGDKRPSRQGLPPRRVLMVLGEDDTIIVKEELIADASEILSPKHLKIEVVKAGHEFPITKAEEVADCIWRFWTTPLHHR